LTAHLQNGPLPTDITLRCAARIAQTLGAAHRHSIIHSDLKPANIMLRPDGTVKVLHFRLAVCGAKVRTHQREARVVSR
jgi:eukaryotic-like serine/threonine-protein kinase